MALAKNTTKPAAKPAAPVAKPAAKPSAPVAKAAPAKPSAPVAKPAAKPAAPVAKPIAKAVVKAVAPVPEKAAARLGRKEMAQAIREKIMATGAGISVKVAEIASIAYEEVITEALARGDQVALTGFGIFSSVFREAREATNPQKPGEKVQVPACNVPKFKAGSKLKAAVNGGADVADADAE